MTIQSKQRKTEGFTIIEVLIVLAIAALILIIVFLAVPALQRSSRNTQRKNDAANTLSALADYVSNNGGSLPSAACTGTGSGGCTFLSDVKFGYFTEGNVKYLTDTTGLASGGSGSGSNNSGPGNGGGTTTAANVPSPEDLWIVADAKCGNGAAGAPTSGDSARQYVAYYGIEGGVSTQCVEG